MPVNSSGISTATAAIAPAPGTVLTKLPIVQFSNSTRVQYYISRMSNIAYEKQQRK